MARFCVQSQLKSLLIFPAFFLCPFRRQFYFVEMLFSLSVSDKEWSKKDIKKMFKWIILLFLTTLCEINCSEEKPNVLLIMLDDFRGGIGALGDDLAKTPNMDLLAKKSFYFSHVYANQALCAPSRNSMLTSRRPDTLMSYNFQHYWRNFAGNYTTMPQHFKDNGYRTESIGKIFHHGPSSNRTDDFPYSWSNPTFIPSTQEYRNKHVCVSDDGELRRNLLCPVIVDLQPESTLPDIQSAEKAREFLSEAHDEPFFR